MHRLRAKTFSFGACHNDPRLRSMSHPMKHQLALFLAALLCVGGIAPATAEAHTVVYHHHHHHRIWVHGHYVWHHGHRHYVPGHYIYR